MARRQRIIDAEGCDLLLDIGANRGQTGLHYRDGGFRGRIVSVEPDSAAYARLAARAASDPLWSTVRAAVGAEPGWQTLNVSDESQFNSLLPLADVTLNNSTRAAYVRTEEVPVRTIDEILRECGPCAGLVLKLDVQGYEREALRGASEALAAARLLDIELCPVELYAGQALMLELMHLVDEAGFRLVWMEDTYNDLERGHVLAFNGLYVKARTTTGSIPTPGA